MIHTHSLDEYIYAMIETIYVLLNELIYKFKQNIRAKWNGIYNIIICIQVSEENILLIFSYFETVCYALATARSFSNRRPEIKLIRRQLELLHES